LSTEIIPNERFNYRFGTDNFKTNLEEFTLLITRNKNRKKERHEKPASIKEILGSYHVFATNKICLGAPIKTLNKTTREYGKRWGVETSFKMINIFRIKPASTNFSVRLFCYLLSVIM